MGCINADGTLTTTARKVMAAIPTPSTDAEIAAQLNFPVYLVRSSLRELSEIGLIVETDGIFTLTSLGTEFLESDK